jgi:hypothetical protein
MRMAVYGRPGRETAIRFTGPDIEAVSQLARLDYWELRRAADRADLELRRVRKEQRESLGRWTLVCKETAEWWLLRQKGQK